MGCGVFGLGSLIVGIGLTVWLGSMALSGSTGGSKKGQDPPSTDVSALTSSLDDLTSGGAPVPGMEPSGAAITVGDGLPAEGMAAVRGTDLASGEIQLTWCLSTADQSYEVAGCDDATTVTATVASDGTFELETPVHRTIDVSGTTYDCAARAGGCSLFGHRLDNPLDTGITAPLAFAAGLPPVDAVPPPR